MNVKKLLFSAIIAGLVLVGIGDKAEASGGAKLPNIDWSFDGVFGSFDRGALRRGAQVYFETCAGCHSVRLVAYRNLMEIGFTEAETKKLAAEYEVKDGPNDEGEMFMRPATLPDRFVSPYANDNAARASNNGALPPDLSLMVKARVGGANYLYGLLTGYHDEAPEGFDLAEGMMYNTVFPGNQIAMPPPVDDDAVEYTDGTKATKDQIAKDVTTFLAWTASPELDVRKRMGVKVMVFLFFLTVLMYALKRKIWRDVH
jgi:ubiquinol-cytochrome c reductase cytochrome c1 subunit